MTGGSSWDRGCGQTGQGTAAQRVDGCDWLNSSLPLQSGQDRIVATLRAVAERLPHMEDDAETAIRIMEGFRKQPFLYGLDDPARQITMQFLERDTSYVGHVESVLYALTSSELEWSDWDAEYRQPLLPEEDAFLARLRILHVWSTTSDIGGDDTLRHEPLSFVAILNAVWVLSHDNSMFQALTSEHGRLLDLYTPQTPARLPALQQSAGELLGLSALGTTAGSFAGSDGELPSGLHTLASPAPPQPLSPAAAAPAYETLPRLQLRTPEGTRLPISPASQPPPSTQRTVATRARYQPVSLQSRAAHWGCFTLQKLNVRPQLTGKHHGDECRDGTRADDRVGVLASDGTHHDHDHERAWRRAWRRHWAVPGHDRAWRDRRIAAVCGR